MKVVILLTGETKDLNNSYAARLIEQGRAVVFKEELKKTDPKKK